MRLPRIDPYIMTTISAALVAAWPHTRTVLGWFSISVGIFGSILPIIPGLPFLVLGSMLIGTRNRKLRWLRVQGKALLRHVSRVPWQPMQRFAYAARQAQHQSTRQARRLMRQWYATGRRMLLPLRTDQAEH